MLTQEKVRHYFNYDPKTGVLVWKNPLGRKIKPGFAAGTLDHLGYSRVILEGKQYLAHRLVWLFVHGYIPETDLDHIDRNPSNNRTENLREVSRQCNVRNSGIRQDNSSGVKGVNWHKRDKNWSVRISLNNKRISIGQFVDFGEAVAHRLAAEQCIEWSGCDSNSPAYRFMQDHTAHLKQATVVPA